MNDSQRYPIKLCLSKHNGNWKMEIVIQMKKNTDLKESPFNYELLKDCIPE